MMRVYLATTMSGLTRASTEGLLNTEDGTVRVHAVTPALREWYIEGDLEELEYAAMDGAARDSLSLLATDPDSARCRVVLAADVPDHRVSPDNAAARSGVRITGTIPMSVVVSVHLDEPEVAGTIAAAVDVLAEAEAGDEDAAFLVDQAQACDLLWYDITELDSLVG